MQTGTEMTIAEDTGAKGIVADLIGQITAAWNAADGAAYARAFAEDASFVDIRGGFHRTRAVIATGHQAIFGTIYRESWLTAEALLVHDLGGVIVAQVRLALQAPHAGLPPNEGSVATLVIGRIGGSWRIMAFHNTLKLLPPGGKV